MFFGSRIRDICKVFCLDIVSNILANGLFKIFGLRIARIARIVLFKAFLAAGIIAVLRAQARQSIHLVICKYRSK